MRITIKTDLKNCNFVKQSEINEWSKYVLFSYKTAKIAIAYLKIFPLILTMKYHIVSDIDSGSQITLTKLCNVKKL